MEYSVQDAITKAFGLSYFVSQVLGHSDQKTTHRYVNRTREVIHQAGKILDEWREKHQPTIESDAVN